MGKKVYVKDKVWYGAKGVIFWEKKDLIHV